METTGVSLKIPKDFSTELARHLLYLSERGKKTNKADLIVRLAMIGLEVDRAKEIKA